MIKAAAGENVVPLQPAAGSAKSPGWVVRVSENVQMDPTGIVAICTGAAEVRDAVPELVGPLTRVHEYETGKTRDGPPVYPPMPLTTFVSSTEPKVCTTGAVISIVEAAASPITTGWAEYVAAAHENDALSSPPVGGFAVTVHVSPSGMPTMSTATDLVSVLKVPMYPVPQS
jgi:hypothetical protein